MGAFGFASSAKSEIVCVVNSLQAKIGESNIAEVRGEQLGSSTSTLVAKPVGHDPEGRQVDALQAKVGDFEVDFKAINEANEILMGELSIRNLLSGLKVDTRSQGQVDLNVQRSEKSKISISCVPDSRLDEL